MPKHVVVSWFSTHAPPFARSPQSGAFCFSTILSRYKQTYPQPILDINTYKPYNKTYKN